MNVKCWCQNCGHELETTHIGTCPYCGKTGKNCKVVASSVIGITCSASSTKTRVYFEYSNKRISAIVLVIMVDVAIALITTAIGFLAGNTVIGFVLSLVIILVSNILYKRKEKTLIHEITKYL
jgi:hypothetical protein